MPVAKKKAARKPATKPAVKKEVITVSSWAQYLINGVKFSELSSQQKMVIYRRDSSLNPSEREALYQKLQADDVLPKFNEWLTS